MTAENIKNIILQGEGIDIEFKTSNSQLPSNIYDTICAFLNRNGGNILLGVDDNGTILGVNENSIKDQLNNLAKGLNNPQILNPTTYLSPQVVDVDGKKVVWIYVPEGSQAYNYKGDYWDRNEDGDFKLSNKQLVANLYARKQTNYTENQVFKYLRLEDMEEELFDFVRKVVGLKDKNHIWVNMTNDEILTSARLKLVDAHTGVEGYTLAAALLFGKENTIASVLPHYKTDALCRKINTDLYDDRDDIRCNLIRSYSRLFDFIHKHLPERPYIEGNQRVSLREMIFRELIPNFLIHREFSSAFPATLTIHKSTVVTENWNRPYNWGIITPDNFKPHPKNPTIANFFRQLGWVEELGYGVRNMFKYCPLYVEGALPIIEEKDIFKFIIQYESEGINAEDGTVSGTEDGTVSGTEDGTVSGTVDGTVKNRIKLFVAQHEGVNSHQILEIFPELTLRTLRRILKEFKEGNEIEFKGAPKIGGYFLIDSKEKDEGVNLRNEGINAINGIVNGTVKNRIKLFIAQHGGVNSNRILEIFPELTLRTLRRILKELKAGNEIEFKGAPKTGGYFLIINK